MTTETEYYPSSDAINDFISWLEFILKNNDGDVKAWANYLIASQDWSASKSVEVSGRQTLSGNPEFYTF